MIFFVCRPIKLVVAKCWDPNPKTYFTIPRAEPVRPIDPLAWVAHTQACRDAPESILGEYCRVWLLFLLSYIHSVN